MGEASVGGRELLIDLNSLEKATIVYDETTDTLYIEMPEAEAEEAILLENDVGVRVKSGRVVGIVIYNVSKRSGR